MTQSNRKLIGTILTIVSLIVYAVLAVIVFEWLFIAAPWWGQVLYFAVAGLGWALPAMAIIRWMSRPDPSGR